MVTLKWLKTFKQLITKVIVDGRCLALILIQIVRYQFPNRYLHLTLEQLQQSLLINRFKAKEDKYFADLVNNTSSQNGGSYMGKFFVRRLKVSLEKLKWK